MEALKDENLAARSQAMVLKSIGARVESSLLKKNAVASQPLSEQSLETE